MGQLRKSTLVSVSAYRISPTRQTSGLMYYPFSDHTVLILSSCIYPIKWEIDLDIDDIDRYRLDYVDICR